MNGIAVSRVFRIEDDFNILVGLHIPSKTGALSRVGALPGAKPGFERRVSQAQKSNKTNAKKAVCIRERKKAQLAGLAPDISCVVKEPRKPGLRFVWKKKEKVFSVHESFRRSLDEKIIKIMH